MPQVTLTWNDPIRSGPDVILEAQRPPVQPTSPEQAAQTERLRLDLALHFDGFGRNYYERLVHGGGSAFQPAVEQRTGSGHSSGHDHRTGVVSEAERFSQRKRCRTAIHPAAVRVPDARVARLERGIDLSNSSVELCERRVERRPAYAFLTPIVDEFVLSVGRRDHMIKHLSRRLAVAFALVVVTGSPALGQQRVTTRWFDINPSQSNTDSRSQWRKRRSRQQDRCGRRFQQGLRGDSSGAGSIRVSTRVRPGSGSIPSRRRPVWMSRSIHAITRACMRRRRSMGAWRRSPGSTSAPIRVTWQAVNIPVLNPLTCANATRKTQPSGWQIAISPVNTQDPVGTNCGLARTHRCRQDVDVH